MRSVDSLLRCAASGVAVLGLMCVAAGAFAQPLMTMEGEANGTRYESDAAIRLSLVGWSSQEQAGAVAQAFATYQEFMDGDAGGDADADRDADADSDGDANADSDGEQESMDGEAFQTFLSEQPTQGYLFTQAATGYSIKYAWEDPRADNGRRMVFLVTPALKTRSPVLWQQANEDPAPFSVVEMRWDGDEATVKTSLDAEVVVNQDNGNLELSDFQAASVFASMRNSTPYYAK